MATQTERSRPSLRSACSLLCSMIPTTLANFVVHLLHFWRYDWPAQAVVTPANDNPILNFELRHQHAVSSTARVVFADVPAAQIYTHRDGRTPYQVQTRRIITHRPSSFCEYTEARMRSIRQAQSQILLWGDSEVIGPDVESRETLLGLAKMTNNAYVEPEDPYWYDLGDDWPEHYPFGWEPDADGFRGYVFATPDNSTVILSIKGTSTIVGGGGPTKKKDKLNDNLLFSCCCASVDWTWSTVCGCHRGGWKCDQDCVEEALVEESLFYPIGTNLYNNLTYMYPDSNIWLTGHSLGGGLASLLGMTFGVPVVAFETSGDKLAAERLHLPSPPSTNHITHVYHTADPIPQGVCTGVFSTCALGGYALETRCHMGKTIVYDTVSNLSWSVDVRTHPILTVIEKVLSEPWAPSVEIGREVPEATAEEDCVECYSWEFGDFPK